MSALKYFVFHKIPRKLLSYLPPRLRATAKRWILAWVQDDPKDSANINPETEYLQSLDPDWNTLGFPIYEPIHARNQARAEISVDSLRQFQLREIRFENRRGTVLVSICTMNYLHSARTMISSVREHHAPDEMAICLLIIDWDGNEPIEIQDVTLFSGRAIGIDRFDYMALKYTAIELCTICKPYLFHYLMAVTNYYKILFFDPDIYIFSRLDVILACLDDARLVVIPHTLTPPPTLNGVHVTPRLKEIMYVGTYNAGMLGMTIVPENAQFVNQWSEPLSVPGAFISNIDFQNEGQQVFNWLVNLADSVKILKDTAYNVAYWNLHDRSLRYTGWDEPGDELAWKVDGQPLVAFHFSGFSLNDPRRLSRYDFRYELYFLPSVTKLVEFYVGKLLENGALTTQQRGYQFDQFPSGLSISREMRLIFKKHEAFLWRDINPWSKDGERYYAQCLFLPLPETSSLLPACLYYVYQRRGDLQAAFPQAHVEPEPMIYWFSHFGINEEQLLYQYFDLYRPVVPRLEGVNSLVRILRKHPRPFAGLNLPMSQDRKKLVGNLKQMGLEAVANQMLSLEFEYFALSPIYLLWRFVKQQTQLLHKFPDFLFADAPAFSQWLRQNASNHFFEPELADIFLQKAQGHSLARIFSFLNESWDFASQWPLALVGQNKEGFISALLGQLYFDRQFDLDDIMMYAWIMETTPWAGLPLTFELLVNTCHQPSPLLPEGQEALLGPLLAKQGFHDALAAYRTQANEKNLGKMHIPSHQNKFGVMQGWPHLKLKQGRKDGVNFFGYFKSPVGLGSLSKGLALAFDAAQVHVQENVLNYSSMQQDLRPEDFIRTYDYSLNTNLFLSYPHLMHRLLATYPEHVVKERTNIVYLAWEQRDGYPSWEQDYAEFDQVWALSRFAAESFRRYMKRDDVVTVPGVIDFESLPAPATKEKMGLDPDRFIFLYVFDASSSIERKNPWAAIRAFSQAFATDEKVQLLLKVTNGHRLDCRQKLRQLANLAARSDMDIRFLFSNLTRPEVLKTISTADCYVSLHRAEGFGYTCAEAAAYAKPVIATNYSGTTEFMGAESAFLVDYKECEVMEADGPFQRGSVWAEPSIEHAAVQMRRVYLDQKAAKEIGLAAQAKVRQLLSAERVGQIAAAALAGKAKTGVTAR